MFSFFGTLLLHTISKHFKLVQVDVSVDSVHSNVTRSNMWFEDISEGADLELFISCPFLVT